MKMAPDSDVLDAACALASVGGDAEFFREIAGLVRAAWPTLLSDLRDDLAAGNFGALEADARLARVAAEYVAAGRTSMAALQIQMMAVRRDLDGARRATDNLEGEVTKLQAALSVFQTPSDDPPCEISLPPLPGNRRPADEAGPPGSTARRSKGGTKQHTSESVDDLPEAGWGWLGRILSYFGFTKFALGPSRRNPDLGARLK